jgi:hypothetical protein
MDWKVNNLGDDMPGRDAARVLRRLAAAIEGGRGTYNVRTLTAAGSSPTVFVNATKKRARPLNTQPRTGRRRGSATNTRAR